MAGYALIVRPVTAGPPLWAVVGSKLTLYLCAKREHLCRHTVINSSCLWLGVESAGSRNLTCYGFAKYLLSSGSHAKSMGHRHIYGYGLVIGFWVAVSVLRRAIAENSA